MNNKSKYEKPILMRLQSGFMNKFGGSHIYPQFICKEMENHSIDELISDFGSPLFVFSESQLRHKFRTFYQAFSSRYPNIQPAWSYKTNYLKAICAIMHQEGSWAEVVSEFEYEKAKKLGVKPESIIFNGPHKPEAILKKAVIEGAIVNIDNLEELILLEKISIEIGKKIKVGMRINMDTGIYPHWSKFGFNLDNHQALNAVRRMSVGGKVILNGLHCHMGTFILKPEAYAEQVTKMVRFAYEIEEKFDFKIDYFDLGGGFPSKNSLKSVYLPPDIAIPNIDIYAEKITEALYNELKKDDFPKIFLESGRAIIDESGSLITTVFASKRLPDGRKAYFVDAGVNILFTAYWYNFNVKIDREISSMNEPSAIYGPLCMNIDVVRESIMLPPLEIGSRLIISPVGAYNITQSMQFIEYRPNVILLTEKGTKEIIREKEGLEDIERRERLPEHLII